MALYASSIYLRRCAASIRESGVRTAGGCVRQPLWLRIWGRYSRSEHRSYYFFGVSAAIAIKTLLPSVIPYPFPAYYIVVAVPPRITRPTRYPRDSIPIGRDGLPRGIPLCDEHTSFIPRPTPRFCISSSTILTATWCTSAQGTISGMLFSLRYKKAVTAPIAVPSNGGNRLVMGLALTPNGSKLLAANQADQSVRDHKTPTIQPREL